MEQNERQDPLIHEGAPADDLDSNEKADDQIEILEPTGEESPSASDG